MNFLFWEFDQNIMSWQLLLELLLRIVAAGICGAIVGLERSKRLNEAGLRTHCVVAVAAALIMVLSKHGFAELGLGDPARLAAQIVSGIGFLGAGVIFKNGNVVRGITTAAGIWATSIVGIALGYGFYTGAVLVSAFMLLAMVLLARFERAKRRTEAVYVEIDDMSKTNEVIDKIIALIGKPCPHKIYSAKSGNTNNIGIIVLLDRTMNFDFYKILEIEHVIYVDED